MTPAAVLLPGIVLPAELAYADLIEALAPAKAIAKDLEVCAREEPPDGYSLELRAEPDRLAAALWALWERAPSGAP